MVAFGITLQPEDEFLGHLDRVLREDVDYFEVAPETMWAVDDDDRFRPNRYRGTFLALAEKARRPFVAHGVALSLGSASPDDAPRRRRWLRQIAIDHRRFGFLWYSDHLGPTTVAGEAVTSPMPLPMTATSAALVRAQLAAMQRVVPNVGFENSVTYFLFGRLADEPAFFERILGPPGMHLVLDLHNVYTMARNLGGDPGAYLAAIDLRNVIEIHLAGGNRSQPGWLPGGRTVRLDSHDSAVPEEVWRLFAAVVPRCSGLRGVTLERMEGTVRAADGPLIREELRRARRVFAGKGVAPIVVEHLASGLQSLQASMMRPRPAALPLRAAAGALALTALLFQIRQEWRRVPGLLIGPCAVPFRRPSAMASGPTRCWSRRSVFNGSCAGRSRRRAGFLPTRPHSSPPSAATIGPCR